MQARYSSHLAHPILSTPGMVTTLRRYGTAVLSVLIAAALRLALDRWLGAGVPFITFFLAVMITAWMGGLGPGLVSSALSSLIANYVFIPPYYALSWGSQDIAAVSIFLLETTAIAALSNQWKNREQVLAETASALKSLNNELERRVDERTHALQASQVRLRAMATELSLAEQRERKRLALELHDHLQQQLALAKIKLGHSRRLSMSKDVQRKLVSETDDILTEALHYTRTLVAELSPVVLRDHGLAAAIRWLATYMTKHNLEVSVTVADADSVKLPEDQAVMMYQCVRELLINCAKHAGTNQAMLKMAREDDGSKLHIDIQDHGCGFAVTGNNPADSESAKFGLMSIRERMNAMGGAFTIDSAPGQGTKARLILPLRRLFKRPAGQ